MFEDGFQNQHIQITALTLANIVNQHVHATPDFDYLCNECLNPLNIDNIDGAGNNRLGCHLQSLADRDHRFLTTDADGDAHTLDREGLDNNPADTA